MATAIRPIGHEDRPPLVQHLDELRTRLIICVLVLCATFAVALWQNHALLRILNDPLKETTKSAAQHAKGPLGAQARYDLKQREALRRSQAAFTLLAQSRAGLSPAERAALTSAAQASGAALKAAPKEVTGRQPVTLGLGEPFGQTLTVSFYFALLFALPFILYQAYAFVLPAFSPRERRGGRPPVARVPRPVPCRGAGGGLARCGAPGRAPRRLPNARNHAGRTGRPPPPRRLPARS